MKNLLLIFCVVDCVFSGTCSSPTKTPPPHIIFILADDMGWNDVSFHGSDQIPTPNIDSLGYHGVILNRHYAQSTCTPSRAALLTGKYPLHTGLHVPLSAPHRVGLNSSEKLLPQYLKELGYSTHIIGKWHLGFYKKKYLPLQRGFDSHFGYWTGYTSYYSHVSSAPLFSHNFSFSGHDFKRGEEEAWDLDGQYATDLFTREAVRLIENHPRNKPLFLYMPHLAPHGSGNKSKPLEAPQEEIDRFSYISDVDRRTYAAMVSKLDQSVGEVMQALDRKDMLDNAIVVFMSDNGAPIVESSHDNHGSNYPFRGQKQSLWEGGVRTPAVIWSPLLKHRSRVTNNLIHITDWLPTMLKAADQRTNPQDVDGIDQWEALVANLPSPREQLVVDIDDTDNLTAVIGDTFKYIKGPIRPEHSSSFSTFLHFNWSESPGAPDYRADMLVKAPTWKVLQKYSDRGLADRVTQLRRQATVTCEHNLNKVPECRRAACLFDLHEDPCEQVDVTEGHPAVMRQMEALVEVYKNTSVKLTLYKDPASNPEFFNNTWSVWVRE